jgi:protocatechuate 3,4-dioxygenase beta subunit
MRMLIATLMLVLGGLQGAPLGSGAIEGRVLRASNDAPIAGARVVLTPLQPNTTAVSTAAVPPPPDLLAINAAANAAAALEIAAITDDDGKFNIKNLAPGRYTLRAARDNYYGPLVNGQPTNATKTVVVEADKTVTVNVGMVQGGVIHGLLRDPDGEPAVNYALVTARPAYLNGREIWQFSGTRNSDDLGEYRIPLPPGQYFIGSTPRAPGPIANIQDGWMPMFYPGTTDENQARPVTLKEGGEVVVNLDTPRKTWTPRKISGVALNPLPNLVPNSTTGIVDRAVNLFLLVPHVLRPRDNPGVSSSTNIVAFTTKPNGEFEIQNVAPGGYELYAMVPDNVTRRFWTAHTSVEILDKDITGVNLGLTSGATLNGEISVTGSTTPPLRPDSLRIALQALDSLPPQVINAIGTIQVDANGRFSIPDLAQARYRMSIIGLPPTAYVSEMRIAGRSVFDDGFDFNAQEAQSSIEIQVNAAGETVEGTVLGNNGKPAANATVALVPPSSRRQNPFLYKTAVTDDAGHFVLRGVAPEEYTIFAWESVLNGAWQNADFMAKNQSRGRTVNVIPQGRTEVQLDLIRAE